MMLAMTISYMAVVMLRWFASVSSLFSVFIINACQIFSDDFSGIIIVMPKFLVKWICLSSSQVVDKHYF